MIVQARVLFGTDPELFLAKEGAIIGAEKVIPKEGVIPKYVKQNEDEYMRVYGNLRHLGTKMKPLVVLDGVQVELHPRPNTCRQILANDIALSLMTLKEALVDKEGVNPDFKGIVEVDTKELDSLSASSRALGCAPSNNLYNSKATIGVNPETYTKRSAGGHIHLGLSNLPNAGQMMAHRVDIIPLCDILVGNTCVMLDRDPGAAERRKVYGRAGEYRTPDYGIEYRTLSNFWLKSYQLYSFVFGMARMAASIVHTDLHAGQSINDPSMYDWYMEQNRGGNSMANQNVTIPAKQKLGHELRNLVKQEDIVQAINTNDYDLARANFDKIKPWIVEHVHRSDADYGWPLHRENLHLFEHFLKDGPDGWFFEEPFSHWLTADRQLGWERFIKTIVKFDLQRSEWRKVVVA